MKTNNFRKTSAAVRARNEAASAAAKSERVRCKSEIRSLPVEVSPSEEFPVELVPTTSPLSVLRLLTAVLALALLGCSQTTADESRPGDATASAPRAQEFRGMCDASAIVALNDDLFVAGDDEDSVLRIFSRSRGGAAIHRYNLGGFLRFDANAEADLEGSARIGDRLYWITSHGNNRKGKEQESRQRFFAVAVRTNGSQPQIEPVGTAYTQLLDDLLAEPSLSQFKLHATLSLPPKTPGALNIEGLAATPEGHLLLGFRNPVPRGKALLVPLLNPAELTEGRRAKFGPPLLIDLDGYGIRSIERFRDEYLIIAGSIDGRGKSLLYRWNGESEPQPVKNVDFAGINPEAISVIGSEENPQLLVVSDDGTRNVNGVDCKNLKDPMQKSFRAVVVPLAPQLAAKP
jgi:hypothetical protein